MPLVPELRRQLSGRLVLGFGGDGAEEPQVMLLQEVQGALGEGISLFHPELPSDVRVDVFGIEPYRVQNPEGFFQNHLPDPVSGHRDHCVTCHYPLHSERACCRFQEVVTVTEWRITPATWRPHKSIFSSQLPPYQVFASPCHHQLLWDRPQRGKPE